MIAHYEVVGRYSPLLPVGNELTPLSAGGTANLYIVTAYLQLARLRGGDSHAVGRHYQVSSM